MLIRACEAIQHAEHICLRLHHYVFAISTLCNSLLIFFRFPHEMPGELSKYNSLHNLYIALFALAITESLLCTNELPLYTQDVQKGSYR